MGAGASGREVGATKTGLAGAAGAAVASSALTRTRDRLMEGLMGTADLEITRVEVLEASILRI